MVRTARSARKELRAIVELALAKEVGLPEGAARRIANRMLRQAGRIAEIGDALRPVEAAPPQALATVAIPATPVVEPAEAFDPYEIGAVVTLHRFGPEGLMDRLSVISNVENLVSLARAQNLALQSGWSNADELRAAIVTCAAQRLAERRAAAS